MTTRPTAVAVALALLLSGCATSLTVRHLDPDNERAVIWVNGVSVGEIGYGDSLSVNIEEGPHRLKATRPGEVDNAWLDGGGEWNVLVLEDIFLSLLPRRSKQDGGLEAP